MTSKIRGKQLKRRALALALGLCFIGAAIAAETGGLRISVQTPNGQPVAGATVTVSSPSSLVTKTGVTNADGSLNLYGLDPATNYTVEINASGFNELDIDNVAVVSGKNLSVGYTLGASTLTTVVVTGASLAAIDTTSAKVGTTLNLDIVEALPTGRSYQSYLQLVPGVKPSSGGNPSSKSGVNFANIGGVTGSSTDNVYYLDGVDVTDPLSGTFGTSFNSEIIQEQQVLTGGIPASMAGGSGLVSRVVTKSGSNEFHGSVNYYFQNSSLVSDNEHNTSSDFSTYDTAITLGGPIVKDKLWFFGSFQKKHRSDDVVNAATGEALRSVTRDAKYGFLKATWQISQDDRVTAEFFNDPTTISGSRSPTTLNNRDTAQERGGKNYKLSYSHDWENLHLGVYGFQHKAQASSKPADLSTRNDVAYHGGNPTLADLSQGGGGTATDTWRNRKEFGLNLEYWLDTSWGYHDIQFGFSTSDNTYQEDSRITGPDHARYASIALANQGVTFGTYLGGGWTGTKSLITSDLTRLVDAVNSSTGADHAYFINELDANGDGTVDQAELQAYQMSSTAGNPTGQVNAYRSVRTVTAPYNVQSKGKTLYLQDKWTLGQWSANVGIRTEQWRHITSDGSTAFKFDWEIAPRLSVVYDLFGDGRSKVWGFYGRYYDPIRLNMADFAGALTGPVDAEQMAIGDKWLTYRTRGGATTPDAVFAPNTKTPYTDEFVLGFAKTIGQNLNFRAIYTHRVTKNLLEDFDLNLYSDPTTVINDPADAGKAGPGSKYYLPYSYFGYNGKPNSNYVISTLPGGKREYDGLELTLEKFRSNHWQGLISYTYNRSKGNSNSDSNADFQGDWVALDPRAPNRWGPMPGNIKHQVLAWGSWFSDFGLEVSGVFHWNSGVTYNKAFALYGRNLPVMQATGSWQDGVYDTWIQPDAVGSQTGPSYYTFDVRFKYGKEFTFGKLELFLDVFNLFNNQAATLAEPLVAGNGVYNFGDAVSWVEPRRAYLGVRYSF